MSPEDFRENAFGSKRANVCDSTRRSVDVQIKKTPKENGWKSVHDCVTACSSQQGKSSDMKVMEDLESRPHCKKCRRRYLDTVEEELPGRSTERKGREEGEEDEEVEKGKLEMRSLKKLIKSSQKMVVEGSFQKRRKKNWRAEPHAKQGLLAD